MYELESEAVSFLKKYNKKTAVSISGGKDSLVALDLAARAGIKKAVFSNTTMEFIETVKYVEDLQNYYDTKIEMVNPPRSFFDVVKEIGFPSRRMRWCCEVFKYGPLAKYARKNKLFGFITGLRNDESKKRANYLEFDKHPLFSVSQINPIINWKAEDVWTYIKKYKLPYNPLYKHFDRLGCWPCPFKTNNEWEKISEIFPHLKNQLEDELSDFADRHSIKDKKKFIEERGWTAWLSPVHKTIVGRYRLCESGEHEMILKFNGNGKKYAKKLANLLPIFTENFHSFGNHVTILTNGMSNKKINILIEKAINCAGCGACTAICPTGALQIREGELCVDSEKCNSCGRCLNTNLLKGACIIRNFSNKRSAVTPCS